MIDDLKKQIIRLNSEHKTIEAALQQKTREHEETVRKLRELEAMLQSA